MYVCMYERGARGSSCPSVGSMDKGLGTCSKVRTRFRLRFRFRHLLKGEDEVALVRIFLGVLDVGQTQVKDLLAVLPFKHLTGVRGLRSSS